MGAAPPKAATDYDVVVIGSGVWAATPLPTVPDNLV
jgi:hypothetical protein